MINDKKIVTIIPARGGSKGIPRKNIKLLAEKPLISYAINAAKNSKYVDEVYVSTDDNEIAEISYRYGAKIIKRPEEFATDKASSELALIHFAEMVDFDIMVFLQCTAPFTKPDDIDSALDKFISGGYDSLLSACNDHGGFLCGGFTWNEDGKSVNYDYKNRSMRQDVKKTYRENGAIYIMSKKGLIENKNRLFGRIGIYEMPSERSFEIDSSEDFEMAERIIKNTKKQIKIGDKIISDDGPILFIGDIGINHNGNIEIAKKIIDVAKICGLDAVKFQKRTPELCVPENQRNKLRETPWGEITYFEYKRRIEFGEREYQEINRYCKEKGIMWSASVWDLDSLEFIKKFDPPFIKVPSAKLTDKELLLKIKETGKPVFLGTGMSTSEQIDRAVAIFGEEYPLVIMACNSAYPAPDEDLNLLYIKTLKQKYPSHIIGYSGHELGITVTTVAATLGAKVIERHITMDRAMWGTDQAASVEYEGLRRLGRDLKKINIWLGDGIKRVTETEKKIMEKLRDKDTL